MKKAFVFKCRGKGVPPVMVVHARCFAIAQREAAHRFERTWPDDEFDGAFIDVSTAKIEPDEKYFDAY